MCDVCVGIHSTIKPLSWNMSAHFLSSIHHLTLPSSIILSQGCFICGITRPRRCLSGVFSHTLISLVLICLRTDGGEWNERWGLLWLESGTASTHSLNSLKGIDLPTGWDWWTSSPQLLPDVTNQEALFFPLAFGCANWMWKPENQIIKMTLYSSTVCLIWSETIVSVLYCFFYSKYVCFLELPLLSEELILLKKHPTLSLLCNKRACWLVERSDLEWHDS